MSLEVRVHPHKVVPREKILIGERIRGVVGETLDELTESIQQLGLLYPVLVDEHMNLIDGVQRIAALDQLGITDIPVLIDGTAGKTIDESLLRRELAANGTRTQYTPVQAAAARRRLRELTGRAQYQRAGVPLAERRKNWSSELATQETGVSRSTMDRVDKIFRFAEDDSRPMHVRRTAAEGLTRIDQDGVPVDRVLREVEQEATAAAALSRYPELATLPTIGAQVNLARHLDSLPEHARSAQLATMRSLFARDETNLAAFQTLRDTSRIGDLLEMGRQAVNAADTLQAAGHLTEDLRATWLTVAESIAALASDLRQALNNKDHT